MFYFSFFRDKKRKKSFSFSLLLKSGERYSTRIDDIISFWNSHFIVNVVRSFVRDHSSRTFVHDKYPTFFPSLPFKIHAPIERLGETRELQKGVATRGWLNKFKLGVFETFPFPSGTKVKRRVLQLRNCPGDKVEGRPCPLPLLPSRAKRHGSNSTSPKPPLFFPPFLLFLSHFEAALLTQCSSACLDTYWPRNRVNFISRQFPALSPRRTSKYLPYSRSCCLEIC